jgi:hypothetical protein
MTIRVAHLHTQGIDFAVFDADVRSRSNADRADLLAELSCAARRQGLKIDKAALAFSELGRTKFYGTPDLVKYLASNGINHWTHTLRL